MLHLALATGKRSLRLISRTNSKRFVVNVPYPWFFFPFLFRFLCPFRSFTFLLSIIGAHVSLLIIRLFSQCENFPFECKAGEKKTANMHNCEIFARILTFRTVN